MNARSGPAVRALAIALVPLLGLQEAAAQDIGDPVARWRYFERCYGVFDARSKANPHHLDFQVQAINGRLLATITRPVPQHAPAAASVASVPMIADETLALAQREARTFLDELAVLPEADRQERLARFTTGCVEAGKVVLSHGRKME